MDLHHLLESLRGISTLRQEERHCDAIATALADGKLPDEARTAHALGYLADHAEDILSLPWGRRLPRDVAQWIAGFDARPTTASHRLLVLLRAGVGTTATSPALGLRLWVPQWVLDMANERAFQGEPLRPLDARWAIPAAFPIPTLQVLVEPDEEMGYHESIYQCLDMRSAESCPKAMYPDSWFTAKQDRGWDRDELIDLAALDPTAAMQIIMSGSDNPLIEFGRELARATLDEANSALLNGENWDGIFSGISTKMIIRIESRTLILTPGWLLLVMRYLGIFCPGCVPDDYAEVERSLVRFLGGYILHGSGGVGVTMLPDDVSGRLLQLPIDWSGVQAI